MGVDTGAARCGGASPIIYIVATCHTNNFNRLSLLPAVETLSTFFACCNTDLGQEKWTMATFVIVEMVSYSELISVTLLELIRYVDCSVIANYFAGPVSKLCLRPCCTCTSPLEVFPCFHTKIDQH